MQRGKARALDATEDDVGFAAVMMTQTATLKAQSHIDTGANLSRPVLSGTAVTFACMCQENPGRKIVVNNRETDVSFILLTERAVLLTDTVWKPGADTTKANEGRRPTRVTKQPSFDGSTVYEVEFIQ